MRHLLYSTCVFKTNLWKSFARGVASESVVQCNGGTDQNPTLGQRWQHHENQVLIAGIEKQQLVLEKVGRWNAEQSRKEKWEEIENYCYTKGINRSAEQCRQRWKRLLHAFFKIKSWESCIPPGKTSFWLMKASERKVEGLPFSLDWKTFNAINGIQSRKEIWYTTAGFSNAEAVSTESPASNMSFLHTETDDFETQQCMAVHHQLETDDFQTEQRTEETATFISSDHDMYALKDKSSTAFIGSTQQTQNSHDDDRPLVLVELINRSLVDLKDLEYDSCAQVEAEIDIRKGTSNERYGPMEVNADAEALESIEDKTPAEGQKAGNTEPKLIK